MTLSPNPAVGANRAVLAVRDASGALVSREEIPVSTKPYEWLGAGVDGSPLPAGTYSITLESMKDETVISSAAVEHYSRVIEARSGTSGPTLLLEGGIEIASSRVTALRSPQD